MTHNLRRHLEWWSAVPTLNNGCLLYKSAETVYMHVDRFGYGGGAVLNDDETTETRGFWHRGDREVHITYKQLKIVRSAVLTFLSELRGRHVMLLHEDYTMGVVYILANLTSRSLYP
eukprot:jgi/Tetstr1/436390/TSEL_025222.t1